MPITVNTRVHPVVGLKNNNMTIKEKAQNIVKMLSGTIKRMAKSDGLYSDNPMFKKPRAKRSDLIKKKKEIIKKYEL